MNTGEFITALLTQVGVSKDDATLQELSSKLANIEISDDFVNKVNQGYFTEASAKANPRISGHFRAQYYNGLDDELRPVYDELELPEEVKAELLGINSSPKRAAALARKVKELTEKKASASKGDKAELTKQIEDLNNQIKEAKNQKEAEILKVKTEFDNKLSDVFLSQFLSTQNYATEGYKDEDFLLPKTKIQKALKEKGLTAILQDKAFKLQTEQGTDYFENNSKIEFKSFAEKVLADNKLTTISEPSKATASPATVVNFHADSPQKAKALEQYSQMIAEAEGRK